MERGRRGGKEGGGELLGKRAFAVAKKGATEDDGVKNRKETKAEERGKRLQRRHGKKKKKKAARARKRKSQQSKKTRKEKNDWKKGSGRGSRTSWKRGAARKGSSRQGKSTVQNTRGRDKEHVKKKSGTIDNWGVRGYLLSDGRLGSKRKGDG